MRVDFVSNDDDWIMIYINGDLRWSGHSIHPDWIRELSLIPAHSVKDWYFDMSEDYPPDHVDFDFETLNGRLIEERGD